MKVYVCVHTHLRIDTYMHIVNTYVHLHENRCKCIYTYTHFFFLEPQNPLALSIPFWGIHSPPRFSMQSTLTRESSLRASDGAFMSFQEAPSLGPT